MNMKKYFIIFCTIPSLVLANTSPKVVISEIQPKKINDQAEWLEFSIESEGEIDISNWKISNGKSTKAFADASSSLFPASETEDLKYKLDEKKWFYFSPSPVSLADGGGTVQILNQNEEILDEITYQSTKSGTSGGVKWSEIWNRHEEKNTLFPLQYKETEEINYKHSQGIENHKSPIFPQDIEILISEISPNRESLIGPDFIELYIKSAFEDPINLKYLEVKNSGTTLFFMPHDFWVEPEDFIVIKLGQEMTQLTDSHNPHQISSSAKTGLSSGSSSLEIILFSGTSWETTKDFACWKKTTLSQSETSRVEKQRDLSNWTGDCIDIESITKNESIARNPEYSDTNQATDFFRHFNGSEGVENEVQNSAPVAVIEVQGSGKESGAVPFFLNLNGEGSSDPDGNSDLSTFIWTLNEEIFSEKENPDSIKIDQPGTHKITLTVTDFSGENSSTNLTVTTWQKTSSGSAPSFSSSLQTQLKQLIKTAESTNKKPINSNSSKNKKDFFSDFLTHTDPINLEKILKSYSPPAIEQVIDSESIIKSYFPLKQKDKFDDNMQKKIAKNVAWIFVVN